MVAHHLADTNLIVRYLVQDHPQHGPAATRIFEACDRGEFTIRILPVVLAECIFVLESFYKKPRIQISQVLAALATSPGIDLPHLDEHLDALTRYARTSLHFIDCFLAATAAANDCVVISFDAGFKKFPDIKSQNPLRMP